MKLRIGAFLAMLVFAVQGLTADVLSIATTDVEPLVDGRRGGFLERVAIEAFQRIGREIEFRELPAERALVNVDRGVDDGDLIRVGGLSGKYPNLRQVGEPIYTMEFCAFSTIEYDGPVTWAGLSQRYVGIIRGWKILEAQLGASDKLMYAHSPEQLFQLLDMGSVEMVVYARWQGLKLIEKMQVENVSLLRPPLATHEMYLYLNQKHEPLIPALEAAIRQMKEDGTYRAIEEQFLIRGHGSSG